MLTATMDAPAYVLPMLADYLLESVFDSYRLTVSGECSCSADLLSLTVYASHFVPLPLCVDAWTGDRPAGALVRLASLLMPPAMLSLSVSASVTDVRVLHVTTSDVDRRLDSFIDMQLLPNRARMDAGYVRRRLAASADRWRGRIVNVDMTAGMVVRSIGDFAGDRWPSVASCMIGG